MCYWAYDLTAQNNPDIAIGPNSVSLNQAIRNYKKYGASEKNLLTKYGNLIQKNYRKIINCYFARF